MRKSSHPKNLESATRNQPENPVLQHSVNSPAGGDSVFSIAWSTDVSQVNPERDKISNFGGNEFISQNLNFYRKQYEQDFKFLTLLTTVIPCISNTFKGSLQNLQSLLGRCMALIVQRSCLELVNRETKQASKIIFNDV